MSSSEEDSEDRKLQRDINLLKQQIQESKDKIYEYYNLKRKSEALVNISENKSSSPDLLENNSNIELSFYNQIMQIKSEDDGSLLTVLFPFNGEYRFGVNLVKSGRGKYSLGKSYLPYSINLDHFTQTISNLSLKQISVFLEEIQRNVYSFCVREDLMQQLKKIIDPRIRLYHCLRYTELEFTFNVFDTELKIRRRITVQLNCDLLCVRPREATCNIEGEKYDDNEEMMNFFNEHFKIFCKTDLVTAYKQAFMDVDKYKFFV